ncbi:sporulation phosphorelay system protein KapB [Virgibacillus soli]|uniref:Sporulation phosphorelay system protein KapB n=1 Tax=Paracerasibacillus soli TaxID=480284 RepID=A0ABU5CQW4_9BACI|nr:sporulation phosphorelay system protein KapB [Virgibacillus soli]MDY0408771.1 sporulation phosphorelay system protein KapB [Virgibacillus soli]
MSKKIGDTVRAHYKSGTYIGKILEDRGDRFLIEVLAVHKHPLQGDIHQPFQVENVFFHERKALAYREKMNVKKPAVHPYHEPVPSYGHSLKTAVQAIKEKLQTEETAAYNKMALRNIERLEDTYYKDIYKKAL